MKVSVNWLQTFFDKPLPPVADLVDALTFHSSEVEEVIEADGDVLIDVSVMPDKSAWMLSHRGVARELATILELPITDPLAFAPTLEPAAADVSVSIDTDACDRYIAAVVRGVSVGPSPEWLQRYLAAIGQRSINNVVDLTNYIMFHLGQPLHAFDAGKLGVEGGTYAIGVRTARSGEPITTLTGESYELTDADMVIVDRTNDTPIGIAGVKGGAHAAVDEGTTDIVIESANFDRIAVRKTSQRLKLRTDASARFENGVVPELAAYGIAAAVERITECAGGECGGYVDVFPRPRVAAPVTVSLAKVNSILGLSLTTDDIERTLDRFGYAHTWTAEAVTVVPPFERDDLMIPEDLAEEIGRIHGLAHIPSERPAPVPLGEVNKHFYYTDRIRRTLIAEGFSEIFTSSFRKKDSVQLANALASDKGYLRSDLRANMTDALARNVPNKDLLGLDRIAIFEIGTVFTSDGEHTSLAIGVRTGQQYKPKADDPVLASAIAAVHAVLGTEVVFACEQGIAEANLSTVMDALPQPTAYERFEKGEDATYRPFSHYPYITRDVALWVADGTTAADVESVLNTHAGDLRVRTTLFDEFHKDGRTSYAFRLVFQSNETTLTDEEVNAEMERVYDTVRERGWEVR